MRIISDRVYIVLLDTLAFSIFISFPALQRIFYELLGYIEYYKIRLCKLGFEKI